MAVASWVMEQGRGVRSGVRYTGTCILCKRQVIEISKLTPQQDCTHTRLRVQVRECRVGAEPARSGFSLRGRTDARGINRA